MDQKTLRLVGFGITALGGILSLVSGYIDDQKLDLLVSDKVNQAIAAIASKEESN